MSLIRYLGIILLFEYCPYSYAGNIYTIFLETIVANKAYVIYSHGLIVEGTNPRPIHEKFGAYEFPDIKAALAKDSKFNLIAHHRPKSEMTDYASMLASWVRTLVKSGVDPTKITLIGFSRGGQITAFASSKLKDLEINTVLLASCWPGGVQSEQSITFTGHFPSIYETTDTARSCKEISDRSNALSSFDEIAITTNKGHGAFYKPMNEWLLPVKAWIHLQTTK